MSVPEVVVGVRFPTIALEIMRREAKPWHFHPVVYRGATFATDEIQEIGLVDEVVQADQLMGRALKEAGHLAALPAEAFAMTKRQVRARSWPESLPVLRGSIR